MTKGINVLSLFNGMSTGHTALDNVGIKVNCILESESRMTTSRESLKKRYVKDFNTIVYLVEDEVRLKRTTKR